MTDNPVRSWDDVRDMLEKEIQVYYTRNEETNRKREEDKKKYIGWIIDEMKHGIDLEHTLKKMPEYSYTFGSEWEYIRKAMMMRYPCCAICGKPTQEIHHIRPRSMHGQNVPSNLIPLCIECHDKVHANLTGLINKAIAESISEDAIKRIAYVPNNLDGWLG